MDGEGGVEGAVLMAGGVDEVDEGGVGGGLGVDGDFYLGWEIGLDLHGAAHDAADGGAEEGARLFEGVAVEEGVYRPGEVGGPACAMGIPEQAGVIGLEAGGPPALLGRAEGGGAEEGE